MGMRAQLSHPLVTTRSEVDSRVLRRASDPGAVRPLYCCCIADIQVKTQSISQ